jgi:hypothetical protein
VPQHRGFRGIIFGVDLKSSWDSDSNIFPDFGFSSRGHNARRPDALFTSHGFCSMDKL